MISADCKDGVLLTKLLLFFIDAFRHDYLDFGQTPFLAALASSGSRLDLQTLLGYSYAIRASIYTGVLPNVHEKWSKYYLDPMRSPFRDWPWLSALDVMRPGLLSSAIRFAVSRFLLSRVAGNEYQGL